MQTEFAIAERGTATPAVNLAVDLEVVDDDARLRAFEPEWRRFSWRLDPATPFQTPEWLLTWWSHFGSGKPHVLVFRHEGRTAGVIPCFLHQWQGRRQLTLMGTGLSDYLDPPLDPQYVPAILEALAGHLSNCAEWDVCDWQDLSADTHFGRLGPLVEDTPCSEVAMTDCFDAFLATRPDYLKRNLRHTREKAAGLGAVEFTVSADADAELLTGLIDLHGARWRECGETGMIESNGAAAFLRDAAAAIGTRDMLRFFTMRLNGRVVAIILALRNETTLFTYLTAFDPAYKAYCFGNELLSRALRYAHENGYRWNFLRGDEAYKFAWGAERIPKRRLTLRRGQ